MDQRADVSSGGGVVDVSHVGKRHRRPTGAPPPLPKSIGATGVFRLALVVLVVIPGCIWLRVNPEPLDRFDAAITDAVVSLRSGWLDTLARAVYAAGTRYGLAASVWTKDLSRAHRFAGKLHSGIVWVNCWMLRDLRTPFGGVKESGVGREGGWDVLRFFTEPKNVCVKL